MNEQDPNVEDLRNIFAALHAKEWREHAMQRFDEALRQALEDAWDKGHEAGWKDRDEGFDARVNPHQL